MSHASGNEQVEYKLGVLDYNCSETLTLCVDAQEKGCQVNRVQVSACNAKPAAAEYSTTVVEALLDVCIEGTKEQFVCKNADYMVTVTNTGYSELCDVAVCTTAAPCTRFTNCSEGCERGNTVSWNAGTLQPGESKQWPVSLTSSTPSSYENKVFARGTCQYCGPVEACSDMTTCWYGVPGLTMDMTDACDPMVCGDSGAYRVHVTNQGSAADENVRIVVCFPDLIEPTSIDSSCEGEISGNKVIFAPVAKLEPGCSLDYTIHTKALQAGDARVRVELHSNSLQNPVVEEESTYIY
jgi:hypothetical protein